MLEQQQDQGLSTWLCLLWLATKKHFTQCPDWLFSPMADFGKPKAFLEPACDGTMNKMHGAETLASVTYLHLDIDPLTAVFSL